MQIQFVKVWVVGEANAGKTALINAIRVVGEHNGDATSQTVKDLLKESSVNPSNLAAPEKDNAITLRNGIQLEEVLGLINEQGNVDQLLEKARASPPSAFLFVFNSYGKALTRDPTGGTNNIFDMYRKVLQLFEVTENGVTRIDRNARVGVVVTNIYAREGDTPEKILPRWKAYMEQAYPGFAPNIILVNSLVTQTKRDLRGVKEVYDFVDNLLKDVRGCLEFQHTFFDRLIRVLTNPAVSAGITTAATGVAVAMKASLPGKIIAGIAAPIVLQVLPKLWWKKK